MARRMSHARGGGTNLSCMPPHLAPFIHYTSDGPDGRGESPDPGSAASGLPGMADLD